MFDQRDIDRFYSRIRKTDSCWWTPWHGFVQSHVASTCSVRLNGKRIDIPSYRMMYMIHHGDIPKGMLIRHLCGYNGCCNPAHLCLGDNRENRLDVLFHEKYGRGTLAPRRYD